LPTPAPSCSPRNPSRRQQMGKRGTVSLGSVARVPSQRRSYVRPHEVPRRRRPPQPLRSGEEGLTGVQARALQQHHSLAGRGPSRLAPPLPLQPAGAQSRPPRQSPTPPTGLSLSLPHFLFVCLSLMESWWLRLCSCTEFSVYS
jgi:hypothetical protein